MAKNGLQGRKKSCFDVHKKKKTEKHIWAHRLKFKEN